MNQEATLSNPTDRAQACGNGSIPCVARPEYRVERTGDCGLRLRLALPGITKENLKVSVEKSALTVDAWRPNEVPEGWKAHREPVQPGHYSFAARLHPDLDPSTIEADLSDGVLTLRVERRETAKPRSIEID